MTIGSTSKVIKYSFVGPGPLPVGLRSPDNLAQLNAGADAMASITHELEEAATDPQLNAWYDRRGYENADKCAWTFRFALQLANGSRQHESGDVIFSSNVIG
jgi:hypothetical protein